MITERHEHAACRRRTPEESIAIRRRGKMVVHVEIVETGFAEFHRQLVKAMADMKLVSARFAREALR